MNSDSFFREISDGLIDYSIFYSIWSYVYIVKTVDVQDRGFRMPYIEESSATGFCSVEYYEEEEAILVCIDNMEFRWNEFPSRFSSKIDTKECRVEGDRNEEIRTVIIPFKDMSENPDENYRMELMFKDKELISIILWVTKMDEHFNGTMSQLQLIGEIEKE